MTLRRALLDLGVGLWHQDPAAKAHAITLRERGKPGGIIATAMAHRANRIAYAPRPRPDRLRPDPLELTPDLFTTAAGCAIIDVRKAGPTPIALWRTRPVGPRRD